MSTILTSDAFALRTLLLLILAPVFCTDACAQSLTAQLRVEGKATLAAAASQKGNAARGAVLFAEQRLSCANCHLSGRDDLLGPDLRRSGDISPESLVESLLEPSKVIRKGFVTEIVVTDDGRVTNGRVVQENALTITLRDTSAQRRLHTIRKAAIDSRTPSSVSSMPEGLVDKLQDRQQFLDLVKYVMELAAAGSAARQQVHSRGGEQIGEHLRGLVLLNEFNCAACHSFPTLDTSLPRSAAPNLRWIGGRIHADYVNRFIADPVTTRPQTHMPDVLATLDVDKRASAAIDLTHYVLSLNANDAPAVLEKQPANALTRGRELFHSVGCVACHSPRDENGTELLPENSRPLNSVADKFTRAALVEFLKEPHAFRPAGRMPDMQVTHWEAIDIANYLMGLDQTETSAPPFQSSPERIVRGRMLFQDLGCANCHDVPVASSSKSRPIPLTPNSLNDGCLSGRTGNWPGFSLSEPQRAAMKLALKATAEIERRLTDEDRIAMTLTALRCVNCHTRGDLGGVSDACDPHFQTTNPNLGPQGRMPPTLTGVGAKLKPQWMRQVLVSGRAIRPYVKTRMPRFGAANVAHLVDLFARVDEQPPLPPVRFKDEREMRKIGVELAGTRGLNCIVCHTFQLKPAATMPAVDLTEMAERLQQDWFRRYMREPQRFSENTVMPSFWPGGRAIRKDVLDGDPDQQIEALWQYLRRGREARAPQGLIRKPMELLATDEAVMLRRSYRGIGKRGIGVGYPSQVNIVFDAEQMRLAMLWQGKFADPGGVWRSQGHGTVRPLARETIQFASGPDLDDSASSRFVDGTRPPHHRFKGYSLDAKRRPTFEYVFGSSRVADTFVDSVDPSSGNSILRRTVTVRTDAPQTLTFRIADGASIEALENGEFQLGPQLLVRVTRPYIATIAEVDVRKHLQTKVVCGIGETVVTVEYIFAEVAR